MSTRAAEPSEPQPAAPSAAAPPATAPRRDGGAATEGPSGPSGAMAEARIDEAMVAAMRERVGVDLRIDHSVNNEEATRLAITRFAAGIGDTNPLWLDPDHASASPYGAPVAPPSWIIAAFSGIQFGWPGLGSFHAGSTLTHHQPIYRGDRITARCTYEGFDGPRPSSMAGQMVVDHFTNTYTNQHDEVVATIAWSVINVERSAARSGGKDRDITLPHRWSAEELAAIEAQVLAEAERGVEPRWWDDVAVGDRLDELIKGPIGMTDEVAFIAGGGAPIPRVAAHRAALRDYAAHPAWAFRDPVSSALEPIYAVHYNEFAAQAMGVPLSYDVGFQRQCWHTHLLTDWMGDDGWVLTSSAQYRGFVYHGDVVRLGGVVTGREVVEHGDGTSEHVVHVDTWARNQRGADVMPGRATIALPVRGAGPSPAARRSRPAPSS